MKHPQASSAPVSLKVTRLPHGAGLALPAYQTEGSAGLDLLAALAPEQTVFLAPGDRVAIPTGLAFEIPLGHEAQVRPRSGLALKQGLTVLNSPGTIDSDYRGEVQVILINLGQQTASIRRGDRIAQMVIAPVTHAVLEEASALAETARGAGGFGSTGTSAKPEETETPKKAQKKKTVPPSARNGERNSKPTRGNKARGTS